MAVHARRVMAGTALVVLTIIALVTWLGWRDATEREVLLANDAVVEVAADVGEVTRTAADSIEQLRDWAARYPDHAPVGSQRMHHIISRSVAHPVDGVISLDELGRRPAVQRLGQVIATPAAARGARTGRPSMLDLGMALVLRLQNAQLTAPYLRWTYFFAADRSLVALAPFTPSRDIIGGGGIARFMQQSWTDEVTVAGTPTRNPTRAAYWTRAHPDRAGAGPIVSHAAPVYWGDRFQGVVATDVRLPTLNEHLKRFSEPADDGEVYIVDGNHDVIADRRGGSGTVVDRSDASTVGLRTAGDVLPDGVMRRIDDGNRDITGVRFAGKRVFTEPIAASEWSVVYVMDAGTVRGRVLRAFLPQMLMSLLLSGALLGMLWLFWHLYVRPSTRIAEYVMAEAGRSDQVKPRVPRVWDPWVTPMVGLFRERSDAMREIVRANRELEQRVTERTRELRHANERLEELVALDPLTGAQNRRRLDEILGAEQVRVDRGGPTFSVVAMDLDHFKEVNDRHGHPAGDEVLREFVRRVEATARSGDRIFRVGGEEFLVFLPITSALRAVRFTERLRSAVVSRPVMFDGRRIDIRASAGVTEYRHPETIDALVERADALLYRAKEEGRDRIVHDGADDGVTGEPS